MTKRIVVFVLAFACSAPAFAQVSTPASTQSSTPYSSQTPAPYSPQTPAPPDPLHHREWEGTFYAGYVFLKDYKFQTAISGRDEKLGVVEMQYESGYRMGARATQNLGDFFAATVEYGFSDQGLRLINVAPRIRTLNLNHFVHSLIYDVSFSPRTRDKRFRPHVELGTGVLLFHVAGESKAEALDRGLGLEDSWEVVFNYGVGFKHLVADHFALVVDFKGRMSDIPTYGLPKATRIVDGEYQPAISAHGLMHAWQFNIGIAHQWDAW